MKVVTEYEVEGCWTSTVRPCRKCGTLMESVPKSGHFNSVYWKFAPKDSLTTLVCCPHGCSELSASKAMQLFLSLSKQLLQQGSTSSHWEIDHNCCKDYYLDPSGNLYPVEVCRHIDFLLKAFNMCQRDAEDLGWIKFSSCYSKECHVVNYKSMNQRQFNTIFDLCLIKNWEFSDFQTCMDDDGILDFSIRKCKSCS
jgi:hypothetical protein